MKYLTSEPQNKVESVIADYPSDTMEKISYDKPLFDICANTKIDLLILFDNSLDRVFYKCAKEFKIPTLLFLTDKELWTEKSVYLVDKMVLLPNVIPISYYLDEYSLTNNIINCPKIDFPENDVGGFCIVGKEPEKYDREILLGLNKKILSESPWKSHNYVGELDCKPISTVIYFPEHEKYIHPNFWNIQYNAENVGIFTSNKFYKDFYCFDDIKELKFGKNKFKGISMAKDWDYHKYI